MAKLVIMQYDDDSQEAVAQIAVSINAEEKQLYAEMAEQEILLNAFWHPASCVEYSGKVTLLAFLVSDIILQEQLWAPVKMDAGYFSYHLHAIVMNAQNQHVRIGDVDIFLDTPIPKDIKNGDIVSFNVQRLDL